MNGIPSDGVRVRVCASILCGWLGKIKMHLLEICVHISMCVDAGRGIKCEIDLLERAKTIN